MISYQVIPARPEDTGILSQVIAEAFHDLPPSRWLVPNPEARRQVFPRYFRILIEHALDSGIAHTTPGRTAVALWLPVSTSGPLPPEDYDARLAGAAGPWAPRFTQFDAALARHHPGGIAHQHLVILAVVPGHQGYGAGTALLRARHALLDQAGTPAYLEASGPRTRALYQRHGYTDHGLPIRLPGGAAMFPMWRPPTSGNALNSPAL